ncbi:MAG: GGDEF domain-containing protein [Acidobacteriaceae bacterium]
MSTSAFPLPHVLIATSDSEAGGQLVALLDEWRYPHVLVEDGVSALRYLTHPQPPAIALIDSDLQSLSGLQVVHSVRQRYQQSQTWLMLMGSEASTGGIQMAAEAGADDFLLKPVSPSDLRVRLRVAERVQVLTQRVRAESEAARFHATHDSLTGLLSRESILKDLFRETDRVGRMSSPLAYLLVDLDSFSLINMNYGYSVGDQILKELGQRLRRHLRTYDLAGRYGEDEFLIGLPGCSADNQVPIAERMRKAVLERPFDVGKDRVLISASIGVAQSLGRSPLVVMRDAERALTRAKKDGRNCIRVSTSPEDAEAHPAEGSPVMLRLSEPDNGKPN